MVTYNFNNTKAHNIITRVIGLCLLVLCITGCKKFVEVDPPVTGISSTTVYNSDLSAAAAVTSIYSRMMSGALSQGSTGISMCGGMLADELTNYAAAPTLNAYYTNSLSSTESYFWNESYSNIYITNAVLEGLAKSTGVTASEKAQLTGEAKFMRAFFHFYLANFYGNIPLVTSTDYHVNNTIRRSPQAEVYQQIIRDLTEAQGLLSNDFLTPVGGTATTERVRPNKGAATALLARVYLYTGIWDSAITQSTAVINNTALYGLTSLDSSFLMNTSEAIWQLQPVMVDDNTADADFFILYETPGSTDYPASLSKDLLDSFETGDQRLTHWIGTFDSGSEIYYYPYKYKVSNRQGPNPLSEYLMVLRLAEQYLIRAEARVQNGDLFGAAADLNTIRIRAGLGETTATSQADLLAAISRERQTELFTEWGHRWLDLKRTGAINQVMSIVTPEKGGGAWDADKALFPIPQAEITRNSNLTQNPGYN